jgi:hypothetical protein
VPEATSGPGTTGPVPRGLTAPGAFEDPSGDYRLESTPRTAIIEVPGTTHDLSLLPGRATNAPRILQEVDGDFRAEVQVDGDEPPADPLAPGSSIAFYGAGLLLWSTDGASLLRLERAGFVRGGQLYIYVLFRTARPRPPLPGA